MYIGMTKIKRVIECTTRKNWLFMPISFSKWTILHGWNKFTSDILKGISSFMNFHGWTFVPLRWL